MKPMFNPAAGSGVLLWTLCLILFGCSSISPAKESLRCGSSFKIHVTAAKPTVSVFYTEPTIYVDTGDGSITAKEIPATSPHGGGQISQIIPIPLKQHEVMASICVTATDSLGNESPPASP